MTDRRAIEVLDGDAARRWVDAAVAGLESARERIDALNVYPVPDGDTGTNLHLTLLQAQRDLHDLDAGASLARISDTVARGALMGARGNSGIITSQLLRGWADELAESAADAADAERARAAFARADAQAWAAVEEPVEGTMLSVTRAAAAGADRAGPALADVVTAALEGARTALARTTEQLPALRDAGVVDAGGCGVVVLIEALVSVVTGEAPAGLSEAETRPPAEPLALAAETGCHGATPDGPAFEVMFLLDAADDEVPPLRRTLAGLGDSLVVVGGAGLWHVHVHTDDVGAAVEAGIETGRPHQLRVTHFASAAAGGHGPPRDGVGVVAWAAGAGLAETFRGSGVVPVTDAAGRRASTAEVLAAVRDAGTRAVVVLPNDPDTLAVAQAAAATVTGRCAVGDVLGVVDGDFAVIGSDLTEVAADVLSRLLSGGGELVTLVTVRTARPT
ncbi:MAG TPA: DAK2 domain-containing protein [Actinomycetales bacterium]|nr:DAK2 domain-containing protein [Actinomycetales bacterium]